MRHSKQRDIIHNIVQQTQNHPTADWVYSQARKELPNISLGTVYRNLGQLVESKTLNTVNVDGTIHYDAFLSHHQHFQCKACKEVLDVEVNAQDFISQIELKTKYKIDRCQIHLVGICAKCQNN